MSKIRDPIRLLELIPELKRCGVTLSLRIRPEDLSDVLLQKLNETELDIIHLDLRGLNGASPKMVKKAADIRGPVIMALADVGEFEDAKNLLAMGADVCRSARSRPRVCGMACRGIKGIRLIERLVQCAQAHLRWRRPARPGLLLPSGQALRRVWRSEESGHDAGGVRGKEDLLCQRHAPGERGWHLLWKSGVVLQDQQTLLPSRRGTIQNRALWKRVHGTEKEAGRGPASQILLIEIGMNEPDRTAQCAVLAMLFELSSSPKPGNVDRCHDFSDIGFHHFLASAVSSYPVFRKAAMGQGVRAR